VNNTQTVTPLRHYLEVQVPESEGDFATAYKAIAEPDDKFRERLELEAELYDATGERYRESFGDLTGESFLEGRDSTPCHWVDDRSCPGWHSIAEFDIALFAQMDFQPCNPSVKKADNGKFENVACYYGATVLLVHGSPTSEQIQGRYRLNDHTVLVVEGVDERFSRFDIPRDVTGRVWGDLKALPIEKLAAEESVTDAIVGM
jgi:hypothetical protein